MKFSVITPTWNRMDGRLERCLDSVSRQVFDVHDFEHIIVDDGSTDETQEDLALYNECWGYDYYRIEHTGRVIARNKGMELAEGEWICWLDSDDVYDPMYLATFADAIEKQPEYKLWVCGAIVHGVDKSKGYHTVPVWTKLRHAWKPPLDETGRWVHAHFNSGTVGTGMFVFHRSCLEKTGLLPEWSDHNQVADGLDDWLGYETGYGSAKKLVGNPWGDDYAMFRKLTQYYEVKTIDPCLYVQYVR